jgi:hypothetical protein
MSFGEQFLHYPDLFPARGSRELWDDGSLLIDFIGGPYRFSGLCETQIQAIQERFGERCRIDDNIEPAAETAVFQVPDNEFRTFDMRGWEMRIDFDYQPNQIRMAGWRFMARIGLMPNIQTAFWTPDDADIVATSAFENLFRTIVAYRIVELGGVLLHSAGVADETGAWLFIGRSNAGKTTLSRLSLEAGLTVLSDDMNAVFPNGAGFVTEQLPFAGDLGQTLGSGRRYPVRAIYHLEKGDHNTVTPVADHDRLARLMVCAPFTNTNPHVNAALLDNLDQMRQAIPGAQLTFSLEGGFEPLLEKPIS